MFTANSEQHPFFQLSYIFFIYWTRFTFKFVIIKKNIYWKQYLETIKTPHIIDFSHPVFAQHSVPLLVSTRPDNLLFFGIMKQYNINIKPFQYRLFVFRVFLLGWRFCNYSLCVDKFSHGSSWCNDPFLSWRVRHLLLSWNRWPSLVDA